MKKLNLKFHSGSEIVAYRHSKRLNQTEFWGNVGVSQTTASRYETGRDVPFAILVLLTLCYGTKAQAQSIVNKIRDI